ncbi:hypothetical protein FVEN_g13138 [Fusarium venenatum]|nr:hypothetical protein FVEN_g13138 [Fusarium venenatum]
MVSLLYFPPLVYVSQWGYLDGKDVPEIFASIFQRFTVDRSFSTQYMSPREDSDSKSERDPSGFKLPS